MQPTVPGVPGKVIVCSNGQSSWAEEEFLQAATGETITIHLPDGTSRKAKLGDLERMQQWQKEESAVVQATDPLANISEADAEKIREHFRSKQNETSNL